MALREKTLAIYKPIGVTPLELINQLRQSKPEYKDAKIAYAGRLDPMAHGVLLLLIDDECQKRDHYQDLSKKYKFEILLGVSTDTYDVLGLAQLGQANYNHKKILAEIKKVVPKWVGKYEQPYPPFSSKPVNGKPLWQWAKGGALDQVKLPSKEVEVFSMSIVDSYTMRTAGMRRSIENRVSSVKGDFRQEQIINKWGEVLELVSPELMIVSISAEVSSGTYVRVIAHELGKQIGTGAIAWDIQRTSVGSYDMNNITRL